MISKVFGVYSASNASKVCFGRDADFQAEKITEDEEADKIKTAVKVETKLEKRRAENSEAGTPDNGHKRKKKKTRKK